MNRKTLIAIAAASWAASAAGGWANDPDYSLELHPTPCKAATARIVAATGGVGTANDLAGPSLSFYEVAGEPPIEFLIDCGTSPETISAYTSLGLNDDQAHWITVAARIAYGLTGDHLSDAAAAVEKCLESTRQAAQDVRVTGYADLPKTHFECWTVHLEEGLTAGVTINPRAAKR
jgi:hypothetical protein